MAPSRGGRLPLVEGGSLSWRAAPSQPIRVHPSPPPCARSCLLAPAAIAMERGAMERGRELCKDNSGVTLRTGGSRIHDAIPELWTCGRPGTRLTKCCAPPPRGRRTLTPLPQISPVFHPSRGTGPPGIPGALPRTHAPKDHGWHGRPEPNPAVPKGAEALVGMTSSLRTRMPHRGVRL